jgi:bifunctional ADP-heptose synthase (sugar kinase/adenylyltransferase)
MDIRQQKSWNVLLVGDSCLDVYHYGICERMSPEAPVPVFKETSQENRLGMSGNVKLNLESLGFNVTHLHNTEEIKKHRFIEERYGQQLFRHDEGEKSKVKPLQSIPDGEFDAVVVSDYNKGFITPDSFKYLKKQLSPSTPFFVDSKKRDLRIFENCILKINELEASRAAFEETQEVVITLGSKGASWKNKIFKTDKVDVFDVCGAGDVFLAALVYGYLNYRDMQKAIILANKCASLSVTKMGTYVLKSSDIKNIGE